MLRSRRTGSSTIAYALLASVAVMAAASLAAVCGQGEEITVTLNEAPSSPPDGDAAVLRLQTQTESVKCGETAQVEVWLDDLPRGLPIDPETGERVGQAEGMAGFQIWLTYDRNVVHVANPDALKNRLRRTE